MSLKTLVASLKQKLWWHNLPVTVDFAITKNDNSDLTVATRGIYVGGTGDLVVFLEDKDPATDTPVTYKGIASGVWHPMRVRRVMAATTATDLVGGY